MLPDRRAARQQGLRAALASEGLDGLLVTHLPNIRYLTGFTGSAGLLLMRQDAAILVTDFRYATQAPREVGESARVEVDPVSVWQRLLKQVGERPLEALGVEAQSLTIRDAERLTGATRGRVVPTTDLVERLRAAGQWSRLSSPHFASCQCWSTSRLRLYRLVP